MTTVNQVREALEKQGIRVSNAQVHRTAKELEIQNDRFTDEEASRIVQHFQSQKSAPTQPAAQAPQSDVNRQDQAAIAQVKQTQAQMATRMGEALNRMGGELGAIAQNRQLTKQDIVRSLVYLYDPAVLKAEAIVEAASILGLLPTEGSESQSLDVQDVGFASLGDPFSQASEAVRQKAYVFKSFAPSSVAGCLPM